MASKNPKVREIERTASRLAAEDGDSSHKERFAIRAQLRDEAGLGKEQRVRGGLARIYDNEKRWLAPVAALAAPFAIPAIGGALGGLFGGGAAAGAAGGAVSGAIPAATAGAGGLAGILGKAKGLLTPGNIATALQGLNAARGMAKETSLTNEAVGLDRDRWQAGEPLRDAGREGLLAPNVADTSHLRTLAGRGNPFALPVPPQPPATPPVRRALPAPLPVR